MNTAALSILCIFATCLVGWNILYALSIRRGLEGFSFLELSGLSYLFGMGAISAQMFLMGMSGIGYTRLNILLPWAVITGLNVFVAVLRNKGGYSAANNHYGEGAGPAPKEEKAPYQDTKYDPVGAKQPPAGRFRSISSLAMTAALFCFIALQTAYNIFRALMRPIESYDAVAIHGLKAKVIYLAGGINENFFGNISSFFQGAHPDYPLLIPFSQVWFYTFLGNFNDILVKMIFPLFYLSFILVFYAVLKRITKSRFSAVLFTFLLATVKQFSDYSTIGYADMETGIYFAAGLFYLYLWFSRKKMSFLAISLISSVFCLWTKNEGTLLALINMLVFLFYVLANIAKSEKKRLLLFFPYAAALICVILAWYGFKEFHGLENENFNLSMIGAGKLRAASGSVPAVLYEYQKQFFGFKKWNIIWILCFLVFLAGLKAAFSNNIKYITAALFLFALGYSAVYIFSDVNIKFFLHSTGSRFLLHVLPVAVFWMALIVHEKGFIKN